VATKKTEPADEKQGLMLRLPKSLHTALRHVSIDRGQSLNTLITDVLEQWWAKQPERTRYQAKRS
jgi:predicted HicB family RNase H-like nuclease